MTPEPKDLLAGAGRTLAEIVLPALDDAFAIEQLKTVLRVLAHLEAVIDEAYPLEAAEAEDLRRFLGETDRAVGAELPSYRELREANVRRKRALTAVIRELARGSADRDREARLADLVKRQLERERRWTHPRRGK